MDWFTGNAHWVWLTLGLVLAGLEMLVPGVYLINLNTNGAGYSKRLLVK